MEHPNRRTIPIIKRRVCAIYVQLRPFEDKKANLKRLVNELVDFAQLDSKQILSENFEVYAVKLISESIRFPLIVQETDVGLFPDVFDSCVVGRVVHQLKERTLRLVTGALNPTLPVELYVLLNITIK